MSAPLDVARLRAAFPGRHIDYYRTIDSTMRAAADLPLGSVVLADEQTAGLGRHGHTWHSEPANGIYCSIVLAPAPGLTMALGIAAARALEEAAGMSCDLRWPNDVMLGGKKVAGILAQMEGGAAVCGIGINVGHRGFPPALAGEATSIALETGREVAREEILLALLPAIDELTAYAHEDILRLFAASSSYAAGRRVRVALPEGPIEGVTAGLTREGYLVVRKDDGTDTLIVAGGVRAAGS
jgi:BirA family biotin operon repressor/biotin-[acetyl-CoA-carboxylase] ligase